MKHLIKHLKTAQNHLTLDNDKLDIAACNIQTVIDKFSVIVSTNEIIYIITNIQVVNEDSDDDTTKFLSAKLMAYPDDTLTNGKMKMDNSLSFIIKICMASKLNVPNMVDSFETLMKFHQNII